MKINIFLTIEATASRTLQAFLLILWKTCQVKGKAEMKNLCQIYLASTCFFRRHDSLFWEKICWHVLFFIISAFNSLFAILNWNIRFHVTKCLVKLCITLCSLWPWMTFNGLAPYQMTCLSFSNIQFQLIWLSSNIRKKLSQITKPFIR